MLDERIGFVISGEKRFQVLVKSTFQSFPPTKNESTQFFIFIVKYKKALRFFDIYILKVVLTISFILLCISF